MRRGAIFGLSSWTGPADYACAINAGIDMVLREPCDPHTLLDEIPRVRTHALRLRRRSESARERANAVTARAAAALFRSQVVRERQAALSRATAASEIRSDYLQLPDLRLTIVQGARLWGVGADQCASILAELEARGFLIRAGDSYFRK